MAQGVRHRRRHQVTVPNISQDPLGGSRFSAAAGALRIDQGLAIHNQEKGMQDITAAFRTLPDDARSIVDVCLNELENSRTSPLDLAQKLMNLPGVPMHGPIHHFLVPAALLTSAASTSGRPSSELHLLLCTAYERAKNVLPGSCGFYGACGAGVGCGIFAAVWLRTDPHLERHWDTVNLMTSAALARIASVPGPQCCKRTTMLALFAAMDFCSEHLGLDLGPASSLQCTYSTKNPSCKREVCPFYAS